MKLPTNKIICLDELGDELAEQLNEKVLDILSNEYGYCIDSLGIEIKATDICWDLSN